MQVLLNINDNNKAISLFNFLKTLDYVSVAAINETSDKTNIPQFHKQILDARLENTNTNKEGRMLWTDLEKIMDSI